MIGIGQARGRARREEEYTTKRRQVEDPYKDRELARVDTGKNAIIDVYGPMAGAPDTYSSVQATDEAVKMQPGKLTAQTIKNKTDQNTLDNVIDDRQIAAMGNFAKAAAAHVKKGGSMVDFFGMYTPEMKAKIGLTPEEEANMIQAVGDDPTKAEALAEMFRDPEVIRQVLTSQGKDGNPEFTALTDRGNETTLNARPVPEDPLIAEERRARIAATRALADKRAGTGAGGEQIAGLSTVLDEMRAKIVEGANTGAFVVTGGDAMTNMGARVADIPIVGRGIQQALGTPQQKIRDDVRGSAALILQQIRTQLGMGARMLDTEKEYERFMEIVNNSATSAQTMLEALDRLEQTFLREAIDPNAGTGSNVNRATSSTPVGGGNLTANEDGSYDWTPGG